MKKLLALALVVMVAGAAFAQPSEENMFGMFFSNTEFSQDTNNIVTGFTPFNGYIVMLNATVESVGGYEVGVTVSDPTVFVLSVTGPNGWTNFGNNLNHLVGYQQPLPVGADGTVLCTMQLLYTAGGTVGIEYYAANPPSIPGHDGPVIANGINPDDLIACPLVGTTHMVATLNGGGVVATENHSLTSVKALFE